MLEMKWLLAAADMTSYTKKHIRLVVVVSYSCFLYPLNGDDLNMAHTMSNVRDEVAFDGGGHDIIHEETHQVSFFNASYSCFLYPLNGDDLNMVHTLSNVRIKWLFSMFPLQTFKLYCLWQQGPEDANLFRSRSHLLEFCLLFNNFFVILKMHPMATQVHLLFVVICQLQCWYSLKCL